MRRPPRPEVPPRPAERQVHGRGERGSHLCGGDRQVTGRDLRTVDAHGQADGIAVQAGKRTHDRGRRGAPVERASCAARDDRRGQAVQHDRRLAVRRVDGVLDAVEPVPEGTVVRLGRRRDIGPEEPHVEPAEAAQRAEPLALPANGVDRRLPVDADAQPARLEPPGVGAHAEGHGDGGERIRPRSQDPLGLARGLAAHVDARDPDSVRQAVRGACESEAEGQRDQGQNGDEGGGPLPEDAALGTRARPSAARPPDQRHSSPGGQGVPV